MLVVHVDIVAIYGSRASEATKKPKGSYCQAWPTPRQVVWSCNFIRLDRARLRPLEPL